jgi:hypothetical protein
LILLFRSNIFFMILFLWLNHQLLKKMP